MTTSDPTLPREQAVVPPAEIPPGPPIEPSVDERRDAQQLGREIRAEREKLEVWYEGQRKKLDECEQDLEAWHRCNEAAPEQYRREDARVKR